MNDHHRHDSENCREIFAQLSEYLDRDLDPSMCEQMEKHMGECAPCQAFLDSLRTVVDLLGNLEPAKMSDDSRRTVVEECQRLIEGAQKH